MVPIERGDSQGLSGRRIFVNGRVFIEIGVAQNTRFRFTRK